jgi:DNA-binding CsgD family transcriptional regulator
MALCADEYSDLLGAIYDCVLEPGRWPAALEQIGRRMDACAGQVMSRGENGHDFAATWGMSDAEQRLYVEQYAAIDPVATMPWHFDVDHLVTTKDFISHDELRTTRIYREYLKPRGWNDFLMVILEKSAARVTMLGFTRHEQAGFFGDSEMEIMSLVAPHVRRAVVLGEIIGGAAARTEDLATVFARLPMPAFLLDAEGRCMEPNAAAQLLLGQALHPADSGPNGGSVVRLGARDGVLPALGRMAAPASVPLTDEDGRAYVAHVVPLGDTPRAGMAAHGRAVAAVFVHEVGGLAPLPGEVLVKLYGLTPAETRLLALLARGLSLDEAAEALGVAMATARTHLARIFDKTGTRRQAELVRLVLSAFPAPPG